MTKAHLATSGHIFAAGKGNLTKPLKSQNHKNLRIKSAMATTNKNVRTLLDGAVTVSVFGGGVWLWCSTVDRPVIHRRGQKSGEDRLHPSLDSSSGGDHRAARRNRQNTLTSETQNSLLVPLLSALSQQPLMLQPLSSSPSVLPPPLSPSRNLYLTALLHISNISVPLSQQCSAAPDESRYLI